MKKLYALLVIVLVATIALPAHAQRKTDDAWLNRFTTPAQPQKNATYVWRPAPKKILGPVKREAAKQKQKIVLYANNRVMRMCREFKGCEKWARGRYALDSSFRITDTEIAYYFGYPNQQEWSYELYVQTLEGGHVHAYKLQKPTKQEVFPSWEEIVKFPGHPFPTEPSQHAKRPTKGEIYKRWSYWFANLYPALNEMGHIDSEQIAEEQIVMWENDKPIWKLVLYARFAIHNDNEFSSTTKQIVREALQDSVGGPFTVVKGKWKPYIL